MGRVGKLRYQSFVTATVRERSQRTDGLVPLRSLFWDRSVPTYKRATPYHFLRRPLSQKWRCSCVQAMVRQRYPDSIKITKRHPYGVQKKKKTPTFSGFPKGNVLYHFLYHLCPLLRQLFTVRMASNRQHISVVEMPTNRHRLSAADTAI